MQPVSNNTMVHLCNDQLTKNKVERRLRYSSPSSVIANTIVVSIVVVVVDIVILSYTIAITTLIVDIIVIAPININMVIRNTNIHTIITTTIIIIIIINTTIIIITIMKVLQGSAECQSF